MVASTHPGAMAQGHEGAGESLNHIVSVVVRVILEREFKMKPISNQVRRA